MKILKYVILLLLLFGTAFIVFVATQPTNFTIERSKTIKADKDIVFDFVTDSTSRDDWNPWAKNTAVFKSTKIVNTDSLVQTILINNEENKSIINFQKANNGTLLTWKLQGKLDFNLKMLSVLKGGLDNVIGDNLEQGLLNIDNYLVKELTQHSIIIQGLATKQATNFIQQVDTCLVKDFQKVSAKMLSNMLSFVATNQINLTGNPFILYEKQNISPNSLIFSICVPVEEEILTTDGSEISGGHFDEFLALKATLTGDYTHKKEALAKIRNYIVQNKLIEDVSRNQIDVFKVSLPKERKPSKWVTEIYVPIKKKEVKPKFVRPAVVQDSTQSLKITPVEIPAAK